MTNSPQSPPPHYSVPPAGYGAAASAPTNRGNALGIVAFVAGLVLLVGQVVQLIAHAFVVRSGDFPTIQLLNGVSAVVLGLLALVAVVFGVIGVVGVGRPKVLAAIGLGIGASTLIGLVSSWLVYPLIAAL